MNDHLGGNSLELNYKSARVMRALIVNGGQTEQTGSRQVVAGQRVAAGRLNMLPEQATQCTEQLLFGLPPRRCVSLDIRHLTSCFPGGKL